MSDKNKNRNHIKAALGIFLFSMSILICFSFWLTEVFTHGYKLYNAKTFDVSEYVNVQAIGIEGEALLSVSIDKEKITQKRVSKSLASRIEKYLSQLEFEYEGGTFDLRNQGNYFLTGDKTFDIRKSKKQNVKIIDSEKIIVQYGWKLAKKQLNISTENLVNTIQKTDITAEKIQRWNKDFLNHAPLTASENIVRQEGKYIGLYSKNEAIDFKKFVNVYFERNLTFEKTYGLTLLHVYEYQGKIYLFGQTGLVESQDIKNKESIFTDGIYVDGIYLSFAGNDRQIDVGLNKLRALGYEKI